MPESLQLNDSQHEQVQEAFDLFDTDRDGKIDLDELRAAMFALGIEDDSRRRKTSRDSFTTEKDPENLPVEYDLNQFTAFMMGGIRHVDVTEKIKYTFHLIAGNSGNVQDGAELGIRIGNLKLVCEQMGIRFEAAELEEMIAVSAIFVKALRKSQISSICLS